MNKSGKSGHPCLIPELRGSTFQLYDIEYVVGCGFEKQYGTTQ